MNSFKEYASIGFWISICFLLFIGLMTATPITGQQHKGKELRRTPSASEGPYWKAGSPNRGTIYRSSDNGIRIQVTGRVMDTRGNPIPGAKVDIWQTDADGKYDNTGFRFRGHVFADDDGKYSFKTIKPGIYPDRTPHIHVKVSFPEGSILTTQLYFPEYSRQNRRDYIYEDGLNVHWRSKSHAEFDFVLQAR